MRKLVLENGMVYRGDGFGSTREVVGELVFNTSMVGYQEVLSDPSYHGQVVLMTYPLIGNYGINSDDFETKTPSFKGFVVKEFCDSPSNFRSEQSLNDLMIELDIPGISGVDTREITRIIRNQGSMKVMIADGTRSDEELISVLRQTELPTNQVAEVSTKRVFSKKTHNPKYHVVAIDCGIKQNIVRQLNNKGCNVTVVPYNTDYETIKDLKPDGVFLSNGPGDPESLPEVIELVKKAQGNIPMFGICLGHQLISLANGAKTYKLKFGHRGGNHPVMNLATNKIEMTSQNHSYAVVEESIKDTHLITTHINLLDQTIEGVGKPSDYLFSVQYHPESAPGPVDSMYLFDQFIQVMKQFKKEMNQDA